MISAFLQLSTAELVTTSIALASFIGTIGVILFAYLTYHKQFPSEINRRVQNLEDRMTAHEKTQSSIETKIEVINTNIEWIKTNQTILLQSLGIKPAIVVSKEKPLEEQQ